MPTTVKGITLSNTVSKAIQAWRDEIDLRMGFDGQKASLRETCRFILEDFADQYTKEKERMRKEGLLTEKKEEGGNGNERTQ